MSSLPHEADGQTALSAVNARTVKVIRLPGLGRN
jgi:hypothetical protein